MRTTTLTYVLLLIAVRSAVASFHCDIVVQKRRFDLTPLKGIHSITISEDTPPSITNSTWSIDPCAPLKKVSGVPAEDSCPVGTQVCGIVTAIRADNSLIQKVIPIAGDIGGRTTDPKLTLLSGSGQNKDKSTAASPGVRVEIGGGEYNGVSQSSVIDFLCNRAADENTEPSFVSYRDGVLRLDWQTKLACFDASEVDDGEDEGDAPEDAEPVQKHWGFLTWFLILMFLFIAAYLIFAGFLNYSRYGASNAWDILPHSDAIRDLPFLVKDFLGSVVSSVMSSTGTNRGGYSAV